MSARCPEGHLSESLDYCDTCGAPMGAAPSGASGGAGAARESVLQGRSDGDGAMAQEPSDRDRRTGAAAQICPHCGAANVADALFCEACGYDFTTGTPPMGSEPAAEDESSEEADADESAEGQEPVEGQAPVEGEEPVADEEPVEGEEPSGDDATHAAEPKDEPEENPIELDADREPEPDVEPQPGADPQPDVKPQPDAERQADTEPEREPPIPGEPAPETEEAPVPPAQRRPRHTPPSRALAQAWVVELWVDPDWYAVQQTAETIPSPGVPDIVLLTRSSGLVGRPSGSLGARPDVDAGIDSAVSRRHAQLTSDGRRWWIEDLGSSNGTFVGTVGEPLPSTPITPGQRVELDRDDRIYVGAWTRLVLRPATDSEQRGTG